MLQTKGVYKQSHIYLQTTVTLTCRVLTVVISRKLNLSSVLRYNYIVYIFSLSLLIQALLFNLCNIYENMFRAYNICQL
jgi:hypothetical protein